MRPRKPTYDEVFKRAEHAERVATSLLRIIHDVVAEGPHARQLGAAAQAIRVRLDDGEYVLRLYRPTRPEGGVVLVSWRPKEGTGSISVEYLDDYYTALHGTVRSGGDEETTALLAGVSELLQVRREAIEAELSEAKALLAKAGVEVPHG